MGEQVVGVLLVVPRLIPVQQGFNLKKNTPSLLYKKLAALNVYFVHKDDYDLSLIISRLLRIWDLNSQSKLRRRNLYNCIGKINLSI